MTATETTGREGLADRPFLRIAIPQLNILEQAKPTDGDEED